VGVSLSVRRCLEIVRPDGTFVPIPLFQENVLRQRFEANVFKLLVSESLISAELISRMRTWRHSGFHVYAGPTITQKEVEQQDVPVTVGGSVELTVIMKLATAEAVTVVGQTPIVDTRKAGIRSTLRQGSVVTTTDQRVLNSVAEFYRDCLAAPLKTADCYIEVKMRTRTGSRIAA